MVAGVPTICGDKVQRSTEVDQFKNEFPKSIFVSPTIKSARESLLKIISDGISPELKPKPNKNDDLSELLEFYDIK